MIESDLPRLALTSARAIQEEIDSYWKPPRQPSSDGRQLVVDPIIVANTRHYIEIINREVNLSFEIGAFNGCLVMMRRLLETLIIECFESHQVADRITNSDGELLHLFDLIEELMRCDKWQLSRDVKRELPKLNRIGNRSAHSRRFVANRSDVDKIIDDFRNIIQELVYIAKWS